MGITCLNCGKTNIAPGTTSCPVCGKGLIGLSPPGIGGASTSSSSARPILTDARGRQYSLNPSSPNIIGSRGCAILLSDPGVPPQAARLTPHGAGFILEVLSGTVKINGNILSAVYPLKSGDKINIGATVLSYKGPTTPPFLTPSSGRGSPPPPPIRPVVISPPSPLIPLAPPPLGLTLKSWGANPPIVEGYIELMDGPHRVEKGSMGVKVATSLILSLISSTLAMLPFWMKQEVNVWFLRIKQHPTGKMISVIMRGEPGSLPQLGDFIAIWGVMKDGNIIMQRGYSYTTDSEIRLKG